MTSELECKNFWVMKFPHLPTWVPAGISVRQSFYQEAEPVSNLPSDGDYQTLLHPQTETTTHIAAALSSD